MAVMVLGTSEPAATAQPGAGPIPFDNSFARLPDGFFVRQDPAPAPRPGLIQLNRDLAAELGIDPEALSESAWADIFAGSSVPRGAEPLAMAYAGHQFGNFVPQLGDGRALLLGEVVDRQGRRRDIQLKGSGRTPFSRAGDGRAALGPVLREYLVSEAMHALGVPTTRALAAVTTGERVYRDTILPGGVLTRVASSLVRVGSLEYFAARGDGDAVRRLADYVIDRHYPDLRRADEPYLALLEAVAGRQADLIAAWMSVGFIHGVMNTDNMALSGETIDYGPCAFMDSYHPETVFSSIDHAGRYAYTNQPRIAVWNLSRLAECLLPLIAGTEERGAAMETAVERATEVLRAVTPRYEQAWLQRMRPKIGLTSAEDDDRALIDTLLEAMAEAGADFTLSFRHLAAMAQNPADDTAMTPVFGDGGPFRPWAERWRARLARDPQEPGARAAAMQRINPAVIPRNHRVERAIEAAVQNDDFGPFEDLLAVVTQPFAERPKNDPDTQPPAPAERVYQTFCGT